MDKIIKHIPAKRVTADDGHYFFGYFDKYPWDKSQRYLLAHKTGFMDRQPEAGDKAVIGMIDLENNNEFIKLAETSAWCWQQGAMLQWLPDYETKIIYNDCQDNQLVARILDVKTGEKQTLCRPVYCVSPDGRYGLSVNFARLDKERPGYGYAGVPDKYEGIGHPEEDGIWLVDIKTNTSKLIITVDQIVKMSDDERMFNVPNWFNHLLFTPDGKRFAFFHRWRMPGNWHLTHMFTANTDGSEIYPLNLEDMSSHYTWFENNKMICFANQFSDGWNYYEFTDREKEVKIIGEEYFKGEDGHCSYSNDCKWMLTDCYPSEDNKQMRSLYLMELEANKVFEIGSFYADPSLSAPTRCDLHPNWSRDCGMVCIDSIHEGFRGIYVIDVSELTL
jgi:hypothetical protein